MSGESLKDKQTEIYNSGGCSKDQLNYFADISVKYRAGKFLDFIIERRIFKLMGIGPGSLVLDLGANTGRRVQSMRRECPEARYAGVDLALNRLAEAASFEKWQKALSGPGVLFTAGEWGKLPFKDRTFTHVFSFDVLEHVEDKNTAIADMYRILAPGGLAMIHAVSSRDFLTWHYAVGLFTGNWGYRKDDTVGHYYEFFADLGSVIKNLETLGGEIIYVRPFHSFFTLIFDERIVPLVFGIISSIKRKLRGSNKDTGTGPENAACCPRDFVKPSRLLESWSRLLAFIYIILGVLDLPWRLAGTCNDWYLIAKKPSGF